MASSSPDTVKPLSPSGADASWPNVGDTSPTRRTLGVLAQLWKVVLPIAAASYATIHIVGWTTALISASVTGDRLVPQQEGFTWIIVNPSVPKLLLLVVEIVVFYLLLCLSKSAILRAALEHYAGRPPSIRGCLLHSIVDLRKISTMTLLIDATFVGIVGASGMIIYWIKSSLVSSGLFYFSALAIGMTTAALVLYVLAITYPACPMIVVDNPELIDTLKGSFRLSSGQRLYLLGILSTPISIKCFMDLLFTQFRNLQWTWIRICPYNWQPHIWFDVGGGNDNDPMYGQMQDDIGLGYCIIQLLLVLVILFFACYEPILQSMAYISIRAAKEDFTPGKLATELDLPDDQDGAYEMM